MQISRAKIAEAARGRVKVAVDRGKLAPPHDFDCSDCGGAATQYEHRDYREPLKVEPVCDPCNRKRLPALPEGFIDSADVDWYTPSPYRTRDKKLQIRMFLDDYKALKALASGEGISMSDYLARFVRREAKKQGIPTKEVI